MEVKHYRQPIPRALIEQFANDIERYRLQVPDAKGLFVVSGILSSSAVNSIEAHSELDVWTGETVQALLDLHPDILEALGEAAQAKKLLDNLVTPQVPSVVALASTTYQKRLEKIDIGQPGWRAFEHWSTEILTDIFKPALGPLAQQIRSDDDLDIMDAVFPIRSTKGPWSQVRAEFSTRFVVGEFKNYSDPIGQKQVESISQYLWADAKRQFGILVSRTTPSQSAVAQRRRAWLQEGKMIVFLTSAELIEMLQMREAQDEPFAVIDAQLEAFLMTLTP